MPMKIVPQYRQEVTHYLLHKSSGQNAKPQQTQTSMVNQLIPHIQQYKSQGYTNAQISNYLKKDGWKKEVIDDALSRFKSY